jgi:hypothetical protein
MDEFMVFRVRMGKMGLVRSLSASGGFADAKRRGVNTE